MNITLVQPSTHGRTTVRPLGLGYLASYLEEKGHQVTIIDNDLERLQGPELKKRIEQSTPDVIGITVNLLNRKKAMRIAGLFIDFPYVVFGGPEPTLEPEYFCIRENYFVIAGEGEVAFSLFLDAIETKIDFSEVKNLVYKKNGMVLKNSTVPLIDNLDGLPFPSIHHFDYKKYSIEIDGVDAISLSTSRGCPFKCVFCYHRLNGRFRQRSVKSVLDEIGYLKSEFGYKGFVFWDDNMTIKKRFVNELTDKISTQHKDIVWTCLSTVKTIDKDILRKMAASGCRMVHFGIESGNQQTLDLIGKNVSVERNKQVIEWCKEVGLKCKAFIMIGFPWETKDDIRKTAEFLETAQPDECQIMLVTPMPNTDLEKTIRQMGYPIKNIDVLENMRDFVIPMFETENFSEDELIALYHETYDRYFSARGRDGKRLLAKKNLKTALNKTINRVIYGKKKIGLQY